MTVVARREEFRERERRHGLAKRLEFGKHFVDQTLALVTNGREAGGRPPP